MLQRSITTFLGCEAWLCCRHILSEMTMRHGSGSPRPRPLHGFLRLLISWELEGMLVSQCNRSEEGCLPGQRCECWKRSQEGRRCKIGGLSDGRQPRSHCVRCKLPWATVSKCGAGKTSATCSVTTGSTAPTQSRSSCSWCLSRAFSTMAKVSE